MSSYIPLKELKCDENKLFKIFVDWFGSEKVYVCFKTKKQLVDKLTENKVVMPSDNLNDDYITPTMMMSFKEEPNAEIKHWLELE